MNKQTIQTIFRLLQTSVGNILPHYRPSLDEQMIFAKRMSFFIGANIPLVESLQILAQQGKKKQAKLFYEKVIVEVTNGKSLSSGLCNMHGSFDTFTRNIIRTGEQTGNLAKNLAHLADELQKKRSLRKKIVGALIYPVVVFTSTLLITTLLIIYIFPKIIPIFMSLNTTLPITTRMVLALSDFLHAQWHALVVTIVILFVALRILLRKNALFKHACHQILVKTPLVGKITCSYNLANYNRTMGLLTASGINLAQSLTITSETMRNTLYRDACVRLAHSIVTGKQLTTLMELEGTIFPSTMTHLLEASEKTGRLSETFFYLSDHYESEVDELTKNLSSAVEPALMLFMGLLVGSIALSIITPMYGITQNIH